MQRFKREDWSNEGVKQSKKKLQKEREALQPHQLHRNYTTAPMSRHEIRWPQEEKIGIGNSTPKRTAEGNSPAVLQLKLLAKSELFNIAKPFFT